MRQRVRKLGDEELRTAESTPGLNRRVAFEANGHWFGHVEAEPETMSGWHHHGDNVTIGYVLGGKITLEFGPGGQEQVEVNEGEYFEVPKQLVHREGNMSAASAEIILGRDPQDDVGDLARTDDPEEQEQNPYERAACSEAVGEGCAHTGDHASFTSPRADERGLAGHANAPYLEDESPESNRSRTKSRSGSSADHPA